MQSAYQNYRAIINIENGSNGFQITDSDNNTILPSSVLTVGDEITIYHSGNNEYNTYYVTAIDDGNNEFTLEDASTPDPYYC